jgi:hypothetical protein
MLFGAKIRLYNCEISKNKMTPAKFEQLMDIIDRLEIKFSIAGFVHLQLFNAIAICNSSPTVQQPTHKPRHHCNLLRVDWLEITQLGHDWR